MERASHEALARLRKVNALVARIDQTCVHVGLHPHHDARAILATVRIWPASHWASLAIAAGKRPPSEETIRAILDVYQSRAEAVATRVA